MKHSSTWAVLLISMALPPSLSGQNDAGSFRIHAAHVSPHTVAAIQDDLRAAEKRIEESLGVFRDTVSVRIFSSREAFARALLDAWGQTETACWMVGAADDHVLYLLSPDVWGGPEVCEHDPGDASHRRMLIAHELVHVYHGQVNASADLGLLEDIGWFIEGLATHISGQLDATHAGRAKEAVASGAAPDRLANAWSGRYRYAVSGSLVSFIDQRWGRPVLRAAMSSTSGAELLALLGVTESEFIHAWQQWVHEP